MVYTKKCINLVGESGFNITSTVVNNCEIRQGEKKKDGGFLHWSLDEHEQIQTSLFFHPPTIFERFTIMLCFTN